jgi:Flp pilus assembly protein TadD
MAISPNPVPGNESTSARSFEEARHLYGEERLAEADALLQALLIAAPDHVPALNLRAVIAIRTGRGAEAEALLRRVIALSPEDFDGHNNLGVLLHRTDRPAEAELALATAVRLNPQEASARLNLGFLLQCLGRLDEAEAAYWLAVRLRPDYAEAHGNLGAVLQATQRPEYAETAYRLAIKLAPTFWQAWDNLGHLLTSGDRPAEAEAHYREMLRLRPGFPESFNNLANVLARLGRTEEAEGLYRQALAIAPDQTEALSNLGLLLKEAGRLDEAEALFVRALAGNPDFANAHVNYGTLLQQKLRFEDAEAHFRRAAEINPRHAGAHLNRAVILATFGGFDEADAECRAALEADPAAADAEVLMALTALLRGDLAGGFALYERRWEGVLKSARRPYLQPLWDGRPFPGQTLLVHGEQGFGDRMQLVRYLPLLARMGGRVVLETSAPLSRLLATVDGLAAIVREGEPLPEFDLHCSMMSLPHLFRTRLDTIPAGVPYLSVPQEAGAAALELSANPGAPLKVGVFWAGVAGYKNDFFRSVPYECLEPLWDVPGVTWVILQKERRPEGFEALARERGWLDPITGVTDFADTAALIDRVDLVIGVDTGVIHLAGALGKPTWLMIPAVPDWRWLLEREDSPWYPSMRLFRQQRLGEWPELIARVAAALAERAAAG